MGLSFVSDDGECGEAGYEACDGGEECDECDAKLEFGLGAMVGDQEYTDDDVQGEEGEHGLQGGCFGDLQCLAFRWGSFSLPCLCFNFTWVGGGMQVLGKIFW